MAGIRPTFITGANAKVRVNDKTLAFCTDLSYSVQVLTQTKFNQTKLQDRIGTGHGSVGVTFEGVLTMI